jgi:hypothetical protein
VFLVAVRKTVVNEISEVDDERFESFTTHSESTNWKVGSFVYRHRTAAPQAAKAGSIPARVTEQDQTIDQVVKLADTRRSERRALKGMGVRLSPWSLNVGQAASLPVPAHKTSIERQAGSLPYETHRRWASAQWSLISSAAGCDPRTCYSTL